MLHTRFVPDFKPESSVAVLVHDVHSTECRLDLRLVCGPARNPEHLDGDVAAVRRGGQTPTRVALPRQRHGESATLIKQDLPAIFERKVEPRNLHRALRSLRVSRTKQARAGGEQKGNNTATRAAREPRTPDPFI